MTIVFNCGNMQVNKQTFPLPVCDVVVSPLLSQRVDGIAFGPGCSVDHVVSVSVHHSAAAAAHCLKAQNNQITNDDQSAASTGLHFF